MREKYWKREGKQEKRIAKIKISMQINFTSFWAEAFISKVFKLPLFEIPCDVDSSQLHDEILPGVTLLTTNVTLSSCTLY